MNTFSGPRPEMTTAGASAIQPQGAQIHKLLVWEEKIVREGEDAPPLMEILNHKGLIAVFDGMGGSGSATYRTQNGDAHSGAYHAARIVRNVVQNQFKEHFGSSQKPSFRKALKEKLVTVLRQKLSQLDTSPSRIKSSLSRKLPTTLTSIYFARESEKCSCEVIWAGDSRAYLLLPQGLQQLSRDDVNESADVLADMNQDSPLTNCISADSDFELRHASFQFNQPAILIVATDGCFGYMRTPAHFEQMLLQCLQESGADEEWGDKIRKFLKPLASDDYSMALICLGWDNFGTIKNAFNERLDQVNRIVAPIDQIISEITELDGKMNDLKKQKDDRLAKRNEIYTEFWQSYRTTYQKMIREG